MNYKLTEKSTLTVSTDVGVSYWGRYVRQLTTDGNSNICGNVFSPLLPVMACYTQCVRNRLRTWSVSEKSNLQSREAYVYMYVHRACPCACVGDDLVTLGDLHQINGCRPLGLFSPTLHDIPNCHCICVPLTAMLRESAGFLIFLSHFFLNTGMNHVTERLLISVIHKFSFTTCWSFKFAILKVLFHCGIPKVKYWILGIWTNKRIWLRNLKNKKW